MIEKFIPIENTNYSASNFGYIINHKTGRILKHWTSNTGYALVRMSGNPKAKLLHRVIAALFLGESNLTIDHIDGNKLNNNVHNLRYCTIRENISYRKTRLRNKYTSSYPGVNLYKNTGEWVCRISYNGKREHLGYFKSEVDAGFAYQNRFNELKKTGII